MPLNIQEQISNIVSVVDAVTQQEIDPALLQALADDINSYQRLMVRFGKRGVFDASDVSNIFTRMGVTMRAGMTRMPPQQKPGPNGEDAIDAGLRRGFADLRRDQDEEASLRGRRAHPALEPTTN